MNPAMTADTPEEPTEDRSPPRRSRAELERLAARFVGVDVPEPSEPAAADGEDPPGRRRSRKELEALAERFVKSEVSSVVRKRRIEQKRFDVVGMAVAVVYISAVAWFVVPKDVREGTTRAVEVTESAAGEAVLLQRKLEAERERARQELASSRGFLEKLAADEAAAVREMEQRARALEARAARKPVPAAPAIPAPQGAAAVAPTVARAAPAVATPAPDVAAEKASCTIHVSELSSSGKLTYADVARMQGVRKDERTGNVLTPPVKAAGGRMVSFEVLPTGCVRVVRTAGR